VAAKKTAAAKSDAPETPSLLPVPEPVIRHHGASVFPAMREWAARRRVPPVLLLTGTAGSGKRNLAYWLTQWIFCERNGFGQSDAASSTAASAGPEQDDPFTSNMFGDAPPPAEAAPPALVASAERDINPSGPCGQCASCVRALHGNWVDFTEVLPEGGEDGSSGTLKVDQFREIKQKLGFGAHQGAYRVVLIPNADRMTVQAANSVLKLLEEPPRGWIFFLTASDPTLVLPTILSRCQQLRLKPFQPQELEELLGLAGVRTERARVCAELAQGSWNKALALSSDETWEHRQALFGFIKEPASQLAALVDWASQEPKRFDLLVDQLEQATGDLIRWSVSPHAGNPDGYVWANADGRSALVNHAKAALKKQGSVERARRFWIERVERLARARQEALAPLNRKLLIQDLLIPWLEGV
jgi:DNA polymerase III delta prime subunit